MPKEKVYKKFYRKADEHLNGKVEAKHRKQKTEDKAVCSSSIPFEILR